MSTDHGHPYQSRARHSLYTYINTLHCTVRLSPAAQLGVVNQEPIEHQSRLLLPVSSSPQSVHVYQYTAMHCAALTSCPAGCCRSGTGRAPVSSSPQSVHVYQYTAMHCAALTSCPAGCCRSGTGRAPFPVTPTGLQLATVCTRISIHCTALCCSHQLSSWVL